MCTYRTTLEHVLYTVLDEKLLNKLAKQYKKQVDKAFNEEEQIKERKAKVKIGKEFLLTEAEEKDMPQELDLLNKIGGFYISRTHQLEPFKWR